jgi:hypothetical protein
MAVVDLMARGRPGHRGGARFLVGGGRGTGDPHRQPRRPPAAARRTVVAGLRRRDFHQRPGSPGAPWLIERAARVGPSPARRRSLFACCPFINHDPYRGERALDNLAALLAGIRVGSLRFPRAGPLWTELVREGLT